MTKKTGTTITIVVGAITLLCCTAPLCLAGILIFANLGTWNTRLGEVAQSGTIPQYYGAAPCCLSILALAVPLLLWVFLVRGKQDAQISPPL